MPGEGTERRLQQHHASYVYRYHQRRQSAVDEGAVYDYVYIVEGGT